jgi:hypothetical protein
VPSHKVGVGTGLLELIGDGADDLFVDLSVRGRLVELQRDADRVPLVPFDLQACSASASASSSPYADGRHRTSNFLELALGLADFDDGVVHVAHCLCDGVIGHAGTGATERGRWLVKAFVANSLLERNLQQPSEESEI